ncbi:hypothetical protein [Flavobacterium sp.]|uniref:hypothetical protein n=1 Tax=Flavobacterium sp. TaxID=239 RepID=UPI00261E1973|nr:hypothetical protein [Flavobacterium sp.]
MPNPFYFLVALVCLYYFAPYKVLSSESQSVTVFIFWLLTAIFMVYAAVYVFYFMKIWENKIREAAADRERKEIEVLSIQNNLRYTKRRALNRTDEFAIFLRPQPTASLEIKCPACHSIHYVGSPGKYVCPVDRQGRYFEARQSADESDFLTGFFIGSAISGWEGGLAGGLLGGVSGGLLGGLVAHNGYDNQCDNPTGSFNVDRGRAGGYSPDHDDAGDMNSPRDSGYSCDGSASSSASNCSGDDD